MDAEDETYATTMTCCALGAAGKNYIYRPACCAAGKKEGNLKRGTHPSSIGFNNGVVVTVILQYIMVYYSGKRPRFPPPRGQETSAKEQERASLMSLLSNFSLVWKE